MTSKSTEWTSYFDSYLSGKLTRICYIHRIVGWPIRRDEVTTYVQCPKRILLLCFSIHRRNIRVVSCSCILQESVDRVKRNVGLIKGEDSYRSNSALPLSTSWCVKWGSLPPIPGNYSAPCRNDAIFSLPVRKQC